MAAAATSDPISDRLRRGSPRDRGLRSLDAAVTRWSANSDPTSTGRQATSDAAPAATKIMPMAPTPNKLPTSGPMAIPASCPA